MTLAQLPLHLPSSKTVLSDLHSILCFDSCLGGLCFASHFNKGLSSISTASVVVQYLGQHKLNIWCGTGPWVKQNNATRLQVLICDASSDESNGIEPNMSLTAIIGYGFGIPPRRPAPESNSYLGRKTCNKTR